MRTLLLAVGFVLAFGAIEAKAEVRERLTCPLNKNYAVRITLERENGSIQRMLVEEKYFFDSESHPIATLQRGGRGYVIDYGNVIMMTQDYGRSGYAFVRLEKKNATEYEAWFDFNLFLNPTSVQTNGALLPVTCYRAR